MDLLSPQAVYENLKSLDLVDTVKSALYRQQAQEILADPTVSLNWQQAIADRLNQANHQLTLLTVVGDDSY
ncbi:MAG: hypothetical protein F6K04_14960 [Leptolyngbya sp. SIO4C5]|uniref:hypothetical protein n=1 Tax=Sphaerothrix gracilis TaxID=3151835 RepID=UPI0013C23DA8|nr:hypothetical protein [Leptolyngbya sp. SIO4C5]